MEFWLLHVILSLPGGRFIIKCWVIVLVWILNYKVWIRINPAARDLANSGCSMSSLLTIWKRSFLSGRFRGGGLVFVIFVFPHSELSLHKLYINLLFEYHACTPASQVIDVQHLNVNEKTCMGNDNLAPTWDFQQCGMCDKQRLEPACA